MKEEFQIHNLFRDSVERFLRDDPHLRRAAAQPFLYVSELVNTPAFLEPGIFMLTGDPRGHACGDCPGSLGGTYLVGGA